MGFKASGDDTAVGFGEDGAEDVDAVDDVETLETEGDS
jgi:hypothetical protein